MVKSSEKSQNSQESEQEVAETSKGSMIINLIQKPFDFIQMMFQFLMYFMVKMATEGCMLPMNDHEEQGNEEEEENEESRKEK